MNSPRQYREIPTFQDRLSELVIEYPTTTAFAEYIGISRQTVGFWLNGNRVPDANSLVTIAKKMNVSTDWLLGLTEEKRTKPMALSMKSLEEMPREHISLAEASYFLGCDPQKLRDQLDLDDELPADMRKIRFPHIKIGNRQRIMRIGFIRWVRGETLQPDLPGEDGDGN